LGNDTNTRISNNNIQSKTIMSYNNLKPDFMGPGFLTTSAAATAGSQNKVLYYLFYESGIYSYSAITYNIISATTTSDVVTMTFYTPQNVPTIGLSPKDLIMSGITLTSNSTGVVTTTLPSTLSFSGTGGGFYIAAFIYSNSGVTPTIRYGLKNITSYTEQFTLGMYTNPTGTSQVIANKISQISASSVQLNISSFQPTFTENDIITNFANTQANIGGFALNVI